MLYEDQITLFVMKTLSLKDLHYPITSIIIKKSVIFNHISIINYYTFIVPKYQILLKTLYSTTINIVKKWTGKIKR